jgi:hypothetical protein
MATGKKSKKPWDIVVDVLHRKNRNLFMPGLQQHLQGEIRIDQSRGSSNRAMSAIGGILPRHRLHIDVESRIVMVTDRMNDPENKRIADKLRELTRSERYSMYQFDKFHDDSTHSLTEGPFRTFMWYMRRFVDSGHMRILEGHDKLPTLQEQLKACDHTTGKTITVCDRGQFRAERGEIPFWQLDERTLEDIEQAAEVAL